MPDFIPRADAERFTFLCAYARNLAARPGAYGVSPERLESFLALFEDYRAAHLLYSAPVSHSPPNYQAKLALLDEVVKAVRQISGQIRARMEVSDSDLAVLKLRRRAPGKAALIPAPTSRPTIHVRRIQGKTFHLHLHDTAFPSRRGKPPGVVGADLWYSLSEELPLSLNDWFRTTSSSRTFATLTPNQTLPPGTSVWIMARWMTARAQPGPMSDPIRAHTAYATPSAI